MLGKRTLVPLEHMLSQSFLVQSIESAHYFGHYYFTTRYPVRVFLRSGSEGRQMVPDAVMKQLHEA
jgi:hypothetical protein